jgi:hypothetical protein
MEEMLSKSKFKPQALKYFREVEKTGKELIISDCNKPVLKSPYHRNCTIGGRLIGYKGYKIIGLRSC